MATSFKRNNRLSELWDKLQTFFGYSGLENPLVGDQVVDEPLTLYVETTGNDLNPGTRDQPLATIQAAIDRFRGARIDSSVLIKVGAGTFGGFQLDQLAINESTTGAAGGSFTIEGTTALAVVSPGANSGTADGGGPTYLDDSTQNWTPGALKGKFLSVLTEL
jgi:hypothetical protein